MGARYLKEVAVSLVDVNGNALTSMSNATVLDGYSTAISVMGAWEVIFEIKDTAVGTSVAPSAITVGSKNSGDTTWSEDANFTGVKSQTGQVANFWRNPAARFSAIPMLNAAFPPNKSFQFDQLRLHVTIGATANLFTPVLRAWVVGDGAGIYPLPT